MVWVLPFQSILDTVVRVVRESTVWEQLDQLKCIVDPRLEFTGVMDDNNIFEGLFLSEGLHKEQVGKARLDPTTGVSNYKSLWREIREEREEVVLILMILYLLIWYQEILRPIRGSQYRRLNCTLVTKNTDIWTSTCTNHELWWWPCKFGYIKLTLMLCLGILPESLLMRVTECMKMRAHRLRSISSSQFAIVIKQWNDCLTKQDELWPVVFFRKRVRMYREITNLIVFDSCLGHRCVSHKSSTYVISNSLTKSASLKCNLTALITWKW